MTQLHQKSVKARFSHAAKTYQNEAVVQQCAAKKLADSIHFDEPPKMILEVGSGTGFLTSILLERFPDAEIIAVDFAPDMVEEAKMFCNESPSVHWVVEDILDFETDKKFDLIVSSSTLQWISPLLPLFEKLRGFLKPSGKFAASIMLDGTLKELHGLRRECVPDKLPAARLPNQAAVSRALNKAEFEVLVQDDDYQEVEFEDALSFFRSLHDLGVTGGDLSHGKQLLTRRELMKLIAKYGNRFQAINGGVFATYRVGYFLAARL